MNNFKQMLYKTESATDLKNQITNTKGDVFKTFNSFQDDYRQLNRLIKDIEDVDNHLLQEAHKKVLTSKDLSKYKDFQKDVEKVLSSISKIKKFKRGF